MTRFAHTKPNGSPDSILASIPLTEVENHPAFIDWKTLRADAWSKSAKELMDLYLQQWETLAKIPTLTPVPLPTPKHHAFSNQVSWPTHEMAPRRSAGGLATTQSNGSTFLFAASQPSAEYVPYLLSLAYLPSRLDVSNVTARSLPNPAGELEYNGLTVIRVRTYPDRVDCYQQTMVTRYYRLKSLPKFVVSLGMCSDDAALASLYDFDAVCAAIDARAKLMGRCR